MKNTGQAHFTLYSDECPIKSGKIPEVKANKLIEQTILHGLSIAQIVEYAANYYLQSVKQTRELRKGEASQSTAKRVAI